MSILSPRVRFRPAQRTDKGAAGLAFAACRTVTRWVARSQQRRQLREIAESNDFHLLKDIGVSREEAFREADKPFWRGLARDLPPPPWRLPGRMGIAHGDIESLRLRFRVPAQRSFIRRALPNLFKALRA